MERINYYPKPRIRTLESQKNWPVRSDIFGIWFRTRISLQFLSKSFPKDCKIICSDIGVKENAAQSKSNKTVLALSSFPCSFHSNTYAKAKWICFVCFQLCMHFYGHLTTNLHNSCKSTFDSADLPLSSWNPLICFWESFLRFSSSLCGHFWHSSGLQAQCPMLIPLISAMRP